MGTPQKWQLNGYKFRRQHPMAQFIADFYCHSAKLVIEVDGKIHECKDQKEYDILRTGEMNKFGITVIRVANEEVSNDIKNVLKKISTALEN